MALSAANHFMKMDEKGKMNKRKREPMKNPTRYDTIFLLLHFIAENFCPTNNVSLGTKIFFK